MGRHRTPLSKARLTGADRKHPDRYRGRSEPALSGKPIGDPPPYLDANATKAWHLLAAELAWLVREDRALVEAASCQRAKLMFRPSELTLADLRAYRGALASLGATPVDRGKIAATGNETPDDPFGWLDTQ